MKIESEGDDGRMQKWRENNLQHLPVRSIPRIMSGQFVHPLTDNQSLQYEPIVRDNKMRESMNSTFQITNMMIICSKFKCMPDIILKLTKRMEHITNDKFVCQDTVTLASHMSLFTTLGVEGETLLAIQEAIKIKFCYQILQYIVGTYMHTHLCSQVNLVS